jgi:uncharacterized protein YdhG (YjbR/CyaY superfamily)
VADTPATMDDYIDTFPAEVQVILHQVRGRIRNALPTADERISYGIPTFTLDGQYLVYFAGWKHHVSVYPVPMGDANFEQEIEPYRAGKGTLKFPLAEPIPYGLIEQVAALLLEERRTGGAADT